MTSEVELIGDGDGYAVIGTTTDVEAFLTSYDLEAVDLKLERLGPQYKVGAGLASTAALGVQQSGRYLKLTEESFRAMQAMPAVTNSVTGNMHAILRAPNGQFAKNLEFVKGGAATMALNPATLIAASAMMQQMALQQSIDEIGDYLAVIDEKVDDVLRAQKDAVLADMIGVDQVIEEAMTLRETVGRVSEVTWSKVQATSMTTHRTQAYAIRQIDALAGKLESASVGDVAALAKKLEPQVREWLAVIAHCVRLQDSLAVLELDRVVDGSPEDLDTHRKGLKAARKDRLDLIHRTTEQLLARMETVNAQANKKVLTSPLAARKAIDSSGRVVGEVLQFQTVLEIEDGHESTAAKKWRTAAIETKDKVIEKGAHTAGAAKQLGGDTAAKVRSSAGRLSQGVRAFRDAVKNEDAPTEDTDESRTGTSEV